MYLLVQCGGGSWRTCDCELTPDMIQRFGMPNSPIKVVRFHEGQFEVMSSFNKSRTAEWGDICDVSINSGIDAWIENCARNKSDEEKRLDAFIAGRIP